MEDSKPYCILTIHHNHSSIYQLMSANYVSNTVCLARVEFPSPPEILSGSQHYLHHHGEGSGGTGWQLVSGGLWGSEVRPPNPARPTVCSDFLLTVKFHQNQLRMESASIQFLEQKSYTLLQRDRPINLFNGHSQKPSSSFLPQGPYNLITQLLIPENKWG